MADDLQFDEESFTTLLLSTVKDAFALDSLGVKTTYWTSLFGGKPPNIVDYLTGELTRYPTIAISFYDNYSDTEMSTCEQINEYSKFALQIDIYTKEVTTNTTKTSAKNLSIKIAQQITLVLQQKFRLTKTSDGQTPSEDLSIYRRTITFNGEINNSTLLLYSQV